MNQINHNTDLKNLDPIEMGVRVRERREFLKFTRENLADILGVSTKFIADVECGQRGISIRNFFLLIQILDTSADYLLTGQRDEPKEQAEKERLKEQIIGPLKDCTVEQLRCMERIANFYAEGIKVE